MAEAKTPTQPTSASTTAKKVQFAHTVPPPQDMNQSKLDWLLLINEEYFEEELKTVVCNFQFAILVVIHLSSRLLLISIITISVY